MVFRRRIEPARGAKDSDTLPGLSDREFLILRALQGNLRQGLYGIEIRDTVAEEFGVTLPWGSLYVMLGRLVEKGFAERADVDAARDSEPRRQYYKITARGGDALSEKATLLRGDLALGTARRG
jgi:DNA-binding PadR family transcriptional regulator